MTIKEVATHLHLALSDVEALVKDKDIPFERQGGRCVFRKAELDAWASQRILNLSTRRLADYHSRSSSKVREFSPDDAVLTQLVARQRINPALTSRTRASAIRDMVALADSTDLIADKNELLQMIEEREQLCSTALPGGLAILHPRHHEPYMVSSSFMVVGRTIQPIHFGAPDGKPTTLFFLPCCQDDRLHLHTLARLCTLCQETRLLDMLRVADSAQAMLDAIMATEAEIVRRL